MRRLALFCGGFAAGIFLAQYLLPGGWLLSGGLVCLALGFGALLLPECWRKRAILCLVGAALALGVRVALAYLLAGPVGEVGIWAAIPIGWALADVTGYGYYLLRRAKLLPEEYK